jgi:hypothetical protein
VPLVQTADNVLNTKVCPIQQWLNFNKHHEKKNYEPKKYIIVIINTSKISGRDSLGKVDL